MTTTTMTNTGFRDDDSSSKNRVETIEMNLMRAKVF